MKTYKAISVTTKDQVATITLPPGPSSPADRAGAAYHAEMVPALTELREDDAIRVIVLTGSGGQFHVPAAKEVYNGARMRSGQADPSRTWHTWTEIVRCHELMAEMEKPIVAKVNGDAMGFGQSLAFACDIIVAREDARFMDHHIGGLFTASYKGEIKQGGHEWSNVPGDGGVALVPMHMSPCMAKEYLMLEEPYRASELARLGVINHAVPAEELDSKVNEIVQRFLSKSPYVLAWTKRLINKRLMQQLNLVLDAGIAYELLNFYQLDKTGWVNKKTFA